MPENPESGEIEFDHVGLLTDAPGAAASALTVFGYRVAEKVTDPLQRVDLRMAQAGPGTAAIEIITPLDENKELNSLLRRRNDYMYHSCFRVRSVEAVKRQLAAAGLRISTVSEPTPAVLFGGAMVSFHLVEGLGLVEFIENS